MVSFFLSFFFFFFNKTKGKELKCSHGVWWKYVSNLTFGHPQSFWICSDELANSTVNKSKLKMQEISKAYVVRTYICFTESDIIARRKFRHKSSVTSLFNTKDIRKLSSGINIHILKVTYSISCGTSPWILISFISCLYFPTLVYFY